MTVTQSIDDVIGSASVDAAINAHVKYILGVLNGSKVISPSDLLGPVKELLFLHKTFRAMYLVPAIADTTAVLGGEDQDETIVQNEVTKFMKEEYPHLCSEETLAASIQAAARELVTAPGTGPAIGGGEDSLSPPANLDARNATARKRPTESPPPVAPHKNARGPAKKKKKTNKPSDEGVGARMETETIESEHLSSFSAAPAPPGIAEADADVARERPAIMGLSLTGDSPVVVDSSVLRLVDLQVEAVFDPRFPDLVNGIPRILETLVDYVSGLTNLMPELKKEALKANLERSSKEAEHAIPITKKTQLIAILRSFEGMERAASECEREESEQLIRIRKLIFCFDNELDVPDDLDSFEGKCSLTRVSQFLELGLPTRRRLVLVLHLGVIHFLLSTHTLEQVMDGLKEEKECINSIKALAGHLGASAEEEFISGMAALEALNGIVLPAFAAKDITLMLDGSKREVSSHQLAAETLCTVVDSLGLVRGKASDKRRSLLFGKGGMWEHADRISSQLTAQGAENDGDEDANEVGYFVPTGGASANRTYSERRERAREAFKLLALQAQMRKREPDWKFADRGAFICNVLSLSSSKIQKDFNNHLSKKYFEREWTPAFAKKIKTKRDQIDKQTKDAVRKYAGDVRRSLVIENEQQLKSVKDLYQVVSDK